MFVDSIIQLYSLKKVDVNIECEAVLYLNEYLMDVCKYFGDDDINTNNYTHIFNDKLKKFLTISNLVSSYDHFNQYAERCKSQFLSKDVIDVNHILLSHIRYIDVYNLLRDNGMYNDTRFMYEILVAGVCNEFINKILNLVISWNEKLLYSQKYPRLINFEFNKQDKIKIPELIPLNRRMIINIMYDNKIAHI